MRICFRDKVKRTQQNKPKMVVLKIALTIDNLKCIIIVRDLSMDNNSTLIYVLKIKFYDFLECVNFIKDNKFEL